MTAATCIAPGCGCPGTYTSAHIPLGSLVVRCGPDADVLPTWPAGDPAASTPIPPCPTCEVSPALARWAWFDGQGLILDYWAARVSARAGATIKRLLLDFRGTVRTALPDLPDQDIVVVGELLLARVYAGGHAEVVTQHDELWRAVRVWAALDPRLHDAVRVLFCAHGMEHRIGLERDAMFPADFGVVPFDLEIALAHAEHMRKPDEGEEVKS